MLCGGGLIKAIPRLHAYSTVDRSARLRLLSRITCLSTSTGASVKILKARNAVRTAIANGLISLNDQHQLHNEIIPD